VALPRTLHCLGFTQVFPVRTSFALQRNCFMGDFASQSLFTLFVSVILRFAPLDDFASQSHSEFYMINVNYEF
jgi:hypothetical protein